jgi:hypothetical protein
MVLDAVFPILTWYYVISKNTGRHEMPIFAKLFVEPAHWAIYKNNDSNYENMLQRYN